MLSRVVSCALLLCRCNRPCALWSAGALGAAHGHGPQVGPARVPRPCQWRAQLRKAAGTVCTTLDTLASVLVPQPDWLHLAILCATALQGPKAGNRRVIGGVSLHGARIVSNVEQLKVEFPQIVPAKRERVICIRAPSRDTLLLANR